MDGMRDYEEYVKQVMLQCKEACGYESQMGGDECEFTIPITLPNLTTPDLDILHTRVVKELKLKGYWVGRCDVQDDLLLRISWKSEEPNWHKIERQLGC